MHSPGPPERDRLPVLRWEDSQAVEADINMEITQHREPVILDTAF